MSLSSYLGDVFSGKIYKENTLVSSNIAKLLKKSQQLPDSRFIKHWTLACLVCIHHVLDTLLFKDKAGGDINKFKKNINKLDEEGVFEMIKLLAGHYLTAFKRNKENLEFLRSFKLTEETFKEEFFSIFSFTRDDEKIFKTLEEEHNDEKNPAYILHLYQKIFEKAYKISDEKDIFAAMIIGKAVTIAYTNIFFEVLDESIKKKYG